MIRHVPLYDTTNTVRAFDDEMVNLDFPVTAIIGTNGGGKSTILERPPSPTKQSDPLCSFLKLYRR